MHRFSMTVEKERPQLNEETKRLIALCRRDPTEENLAALRRQVAANYDAVVARKKAKLEALKRTARHQSKIDDAQTKGACGGIDFWGNCWEWTSTARGKGKNAVKGGAFDSKRTARASSAGAPADASSSNSRRISSREVRQASRFSEIRADGGEGAILHSEASWDRAELREAEAFVEMPGVDVIRPNGEVPSVVLSNLSDNPAFAVAVNGALIPGDAFKGFAGGTADGVFSLALKPPVLDGVQAGNGAGGFSVSVATFENLRYVLKRATDLNGTFVPVNAKAAEAIGTGKSVQLIDASPDRPPDRAFYRVGVSIP